MLEVNRDRRFAWVEASRLDPSKILPKRSFDTELAKSIKNNGVQQPIIVRPSPSKKGMYEIIDGLLRRRSVQDNQKVLVDVRHGVDDAEVFKISEATFRRKPRNTYERARFYSSWVGTIEAKHGSRGAQARVAKMANLGEAEVSHYLSIGRLFEELLASNITERIFNALKNQGVNKLYEIAKVKDKSAMLEVAEKMAENPDMSLKDLKHLIEEQTSSVRAIERLVDEDDDEESESTRINQLTTAVQELEVALNNAREVLTVFTARIVDNPSGFIYPHIFKRIRTMLNAVKKIQKEANQIIRSGKKASVSNKHGGV